MVSNNRAHRAAPSLTPFVTRPDTDFSTLILTATITEPDTACLTRRGMASFTLSGTRRETTGFRLPETPADTSVVTACAAASLTPFLASFVTALVTCSETPPGKPAVSRPGGNRAGRDPLRLPHCLDASGSSSQGAAGESLRRPPPPLNPRTRDPGTLSSELLPLEPSFLLDTRPSSAQYAPIKLHVSPALTLMEVSYV